MDEILAVEVFTETGIFINEENFNSTNESFQLSELLGPKRDNLYIVIPITIIYVIIFITGVVGNISTCVVISRNKSMQTATNYYLFSLAVSDLLLLVLGLPQEMFSIWFRYPYIFGQTFCVLRGLFSETSANATVLTITAFTVERYLAICHPFLSHTMSKLSRAVKFILIIWVVAIFFAIPQALQFNVAAMVHEHSESEVCQVTRNIVPHSFAFSTFVFFIAPMSLITVLYVLIGLRLRNSSRIKKMPGDSIRSSNLMNSTTNRSRNLKSRQCQSSRRVLKMLVAVVVAFFVCWAPFHTQRLVAIYGNFPTDHEQRRKFIKIYEIVTYISGVLYYISTTINPLLYNIMSNKFRDAFKETFSRCCGMACLKTQRPQCSYSILSRSHRRGADSHTDESTGRDEPSVQTNVTLTHKNSQESMTLYPNANRASNRLKSEMLENNNGQRSHQLSKVSEVNKDVPRTRTGKLLCKGSRRGSRSDTIKFWNFMICVARRPSDSIIPPYLAPLKNETQYNVEFERSNNIRNLSTSSCDISNSSLKDVDNALLEDELTNYLKMVRYQP